MNTNRKAILDSIFIDSKLKHNALQLKWYKKNNIEYIYNLIFLETEFLNVYENITLRERIFYIEKDYNSAKLCKFCNNKTTFHPNTLSITTICKNID